MNLNFDYFTDYSVVYSYDNDGYINKITTKNREYSLFFWPNIY